MNIFQGYNEEEDKENNQSTKSVQQKKRRGRKSRLSLKRTADRLTKEINKRVKTQKGGGESVFSVTEDDENYFVLEISGTRSFHKTEAAQEITYKAKLKHPAPDKNLSDLHPHLIALFESLIEEMRVKYGDFGIARIYIDHPNLEKAIIVTPREIRELNVQDILDYIDEVVNSAGEIPADEALDINVAVIKSIVGGARMYIYNTEHFTKKRSVITINNSDNTCLPRAIVVGLAHLDMMKNKGVDAYKKRYDCIRNSRTSRQGQEAVELRSKVGIGDRVGTLADIKTYEDYLKVCINVISLSCNKKIIQGSEQYKDKIYLIHTLDNVFDKVGHFDTVTNVGGVLGVQYFCEQCAKGFHNRDQHKCKVWCNICGRGNCVKREVVKCSDCNRTCRSRECFKAHKKSTVNGKGANKGKKIPSLCQQNWLCTQCGITLKTEKRKPGEHECGECLCNICQQYYDGDYHLCYMRSIEPEDRNDKFIFYDFECQQDNEKKQHIPNYVVSHSCCELCEKDPVTSTSKCYSCGSRCDMCNEYNSELKEYENMPCEGCGFRQVIFSGRNTTEQFCKWLFTKSHKGYNVIAHNARGYDSYFLYDYLMLTGNRPDPVIFSGSKIMYMNVNRLSMRLLDSLNFLPMPLAKLPKSFGLEEKKKGFFPHFFNTKEHEYDVLPSMPEMHYYDPDSMSKERRTEFLAWYEEHRNQLFDFQKEMKEYCISDVDILLNACCKFRELVKSATGVKEEIEDVHNMVFKTIYQNAVDPFAFLTIASVCMGIFRSKFLEETWLVLTKEEADKNPTCLHNNECVCDWIPARKINGFSELEVLVNTKWVKSENVTIVKRKFLNSPIGVIPQSGYSGDRHSKNSIEWLLSLEKKKNDEGKNIRIQHARTEEGEKVVTFTQGVKRPVRYKLDGYFEYNGRKFACEYQGCNWHGCPRCFVSDRESTMNGGKSLAQRYRETELKVKRLEDMGFIVIQKWSCEFQKELEDNPELSTFVKSLNIQDPINLRDCYFGGRTNALTLYKKFPKNEKGKYVDFTSLYPAVMKYKRYPIGHPQRVINRFKGITVEKCQGNCIYNKCEGKHLKLPYFGIMKAKFIPPRNVYHPVLPVRINGKLMFPLCYTCAKNENQEKECKCSTSERAFTYTYCTPEVEVAINMGYIIEEIYEILHWPDSSMYEKCKPNSGLFSGYVNTFLKLKQQASGFPSNISTEEEKDEYIQMYLENEGILLDKELIEKNPGIRSISKLALNSFYGKFGQKTNMKKSEFIDDIGQFFKRVTDHSKHFLDFHIMNEKVILLEFKNSEDFDPANYNTNVLIAAFCTCWARLELWSIMNRLGNRVLYHDTDSIIFSLNDTDMYNPPIGEYLGQLTDELCCKEVGCTGCEEGHWITEFVSCGPKNYSFQVNTGQIICKVRGFSLNYRNSQIVNFQSMKDTLFSWKKKENPELITITTEICRHKYANPVVYTREVKKKYNVVYNKRRVLDDLTTLPYGY